MFHESGPLAVVYFIAAAKDIAGFVPYAGMRESFAFDSIMRAQIVVQTARFLRSHLG
jgi:hypothetical protein